MKLLSALSSLFFALPLLAEDAAPNVSISSATFPKMALYNFEFDAGLTVGWVEPKENATINYRISVTNYPDFAPITGELKFDESATGDISESGVVQGAYYNGYTIPGIILPNGVRREVVLELLLDGKSVSSKKAVINGMPGWCSLLPIIILLAIAMLSSMALFALVVGLFLSAMFINGFRPDIGFLRMLDHYLIEAVINPDNCKVIFFTWYLSGMIALIQKSGGAQGMAQSVTKFATTRLRGQIATFVAGCIIFFDDYASCLTVGANMNPVSDALYISREKLAFLVHATSSPPASIMPISSWIGFELSQISTQLNTLNIEGDAFSIFIETIPSRFYPLFMLLFIIYLMGSRRDFGPMLKAERRAFFEKRVVDDENEFHLGDGLDTTLDPRPGTPLRWYNAVIPIFVVIFATVAGLFVSGYYSLLKQYESGDTTVVFGAPQLAGNGDPYGSLLYSSFGACIVCWIMYRVQRIMSFTEGVAIFVHGCKDIMESLLILCLAWSIGKAFTDLQAAKFIVSAIAGNLDPRALPTIVFILSCIISFTTGTSWGTMSIMFPLVIPLVNALAPKDHDLLVHTISSILTGAIFGDQCSPISGTSILSALSSKCPVREHVRTQLPYALLVSLTSVIFGYLPVSYGAFPHWAGLLIGSVFMIIMIFILGVPTESRVPDRIDWVLHKFFGRALPDQGHEEVESGNVVMPTPDNYELTNKAEKHI